MDKQDVRLKSKNVRRFYVPKTAVIYFSDDELSIFNDFSKNIAEYTEFIQIGSVDKSKENQKTNRFKKHFYPWIEFKKDQERIMKPSTFFNTVGLDIWKMMKGVDIAIIVYKTNDVETLEYVDELTSILFRNDVFAFHFAAENFVISSESKKRYDKLIKTIERKRQLHVPIKEESIVLAYKNASITNRNYYTNLYINSLIDLYLSPFLDPKRNPDAFSRIKALFYQSRKNFESKVVTSVGYSDAKIDNVDLALIQALSNPMFAAAFDASNTFIISVKMPFFLDFHIDRIREVLTAVVGEWKQFYILSSLGTYEYDKYCHISIMAINVNESKLISDSDKIEEYIKKILQNVQDSKKLFENNETKTILLEQKIDLLED